MAGLIHPLSVVDIDVIIGAGTRVWQFASLIRGARIGAGCTIASCAVVDGAEAGDGCSIGHGASVHPGVVLGSSVFVGPGAVICNDAFPRVDKTGFDITELTSGRVVTVRVEDGASIGAGAVILPGVTIGRGAAVAAGAVCGVDVPAGHLFKRSGAVCEINEVWAKRRMKAAC